MISKKGAYLVETTALLQVLIYPREQSHNHDSLDNKFNLAYHKDMYIIM